MKIIINTALTLLFFAFSSSVFATSAEEIIQKNHSALLKELQAYLAENPEASDAGEARSKAIESAYFTNNKETMVRLLQSQFESLRSQDTINPQELAQTGMMLVQFSTEIGKAEIAKEVQATFNDLAEKGESEVYTQVSEMLEAQLNKPSIGSTPELSGTTLDGKELSLSDYKGKVVMLDFWATWCGPCIAEMPNVRKVYDKYHDKGFDIVAISLDRSIDPLKEYISENEISWANIYDADQTASLADQFSITSIPSIFILDQTGKIVAVDVRGDQLEKVVSDLLGE